MSLSTILVRVSFRPVFSSSIVRTGLSILDSGSAFFLSVVEALTVKAQILVPVARHFVLFRTPPFFQNKTFVGKCFSCVLSVRDTCYSLLAILGHRAGSVKSLTTSMKNTYCLFQIKFITQYTNVQQVIITQILLKLFN